MLNFEKDLFEEFMKCIDFSDKRVGEILGGGKQKDTKNELVVFVDNVEEFMDLEGGKMGPFEKGQIANIPKEIVKILIDDNKVEIIEK